MNCSCTQKPSIQLLELYALVIAIDIWAPLLKGKHVRLRSDNMSTVFEINKKSSCNEEHLALLRHMTRTCLTFQVYLTACHKEGRKKCAQRPAIKEEVRPIQTGGRPMLQITAKGDRIITIPPNLEQAPVLGVQPKRGRGWPKNIVQCSSGAQ